MANSIDISKHRTYTIALLEAADDGLIDARELAQSLLCWMSESEVKSFCDHYRYFEYDETN